MKRRLPPTLYALSPGDVGAAHVDRFAIRAAEAIAAGLEGLLLREPELSDKATLALALALRARLGDGVYLGVHDRVHLALAARADGVHVGWRSIPPRDARAILPEHVAVGFSAHAGDEELVRDGADHVLLGPVFDTPSKRGVKPPMEIAGLRAELARTKLPAWALGGIDARNAHAVLACGARGIAVRGALFGAPDVARATRELLAALA